MSDDVKNVTWTDTKQVINDNQFGGFSSRVKQLTNLFEVCLLTTELNPSTDLNAEFVAVIIWHPDFGHLEFDDRVAIINRTNDLGHSSVLNALHMIANAIDMVRSRQNENS